LKGTEVVAEIVPLPGGVITIQETGVTTEEIVVDPITVEQSTQEERHGVTHRVSLCSELVKTNSEALKLEVVTDEFDVDTLKKMMKQQSARAMKKTCNLHLTQLLMHQSA
jgi:hypothetical protein